MLPLHHSAFCRRSGSNRHGGCPPAVFETAAYTFPPLRPLIEKCRGPESNWGHADFQSAALPTELPRRKQYSKFCPSKVSRTGSKFLPAHLIITIRRVKTKIIPWEKTTRISQKHRYTSNYSSPLPRKNNKTHPQRRSVIMRHKTRGSVGKYH